MVRLDDGTNIDLHCVKCNKITTHLGMIDGSGDMCSICHTIKPVQTKRDDKV